MTQEIKCYIDVPCKNFDDFLNISNSLFQLTELRRETWMFRGQREYKCDLRTTLERAFERLDITDKNDKTRIESNMIREFKRRLHQYVPNTPNNSSTDEWLALMQHYGAPTRLLDFSYSQYVAAYFAFEKAEQNSYVSIWAINMDDLNENIEAKYPYIYKDFVEYRHTRSLKGESPAFDNIFIQKQIKKTRLSKSTIFAKPRGKLILAVNPFRLNDRLAFQMGSFLCPVDITVGFMENLSACTKNPNSELEKRVLKFTIPTGKNNKNTIDALYRLDSMNISRITLFPGLEGFTQSFTSRIWPVFMRQYL